MYQLPRNVKRVLNRRMAPFGLSRRPKTILAVYTIATLIGRFHCHPDQFDKRGCGQGEDGGFHLDRRGLSGQTGKVLRGAEGLTEWTIREATAILTAIGFVERMTSKALAYRADKNGRFGRWLEAKKDGFGRIRAPGIRFKLGNSFRSIFAKTLGRNSNARGFKGKPPVDGEPIIQDYQKGKSGEVGVSTGGRPPMTQERMRAVHAQVIAERAAAQAPNRRAAFLADLEERRRHREAQEDEARLAATIAEALAMVRAKGIER